MTGSTSTLSGQIYSQLRAEILSDRYAAGDALPSERRLSEELETNRHAVREALKRLQQAGLVAISQGPSPRSNATSTRAKTGNMWDSTCGLALWLMTT